MIVVVVVMVVVVGHPAPGDCCCCLSVSLLPISVDTIVIRLQQIWQRARAGNIQLVRLVTHFS